VPKPKKQRMPHDVNRLAARIVAETTKERPKPKKG
jgi:hypothetical protein